MSSINNDDNAMNVGNVIRKSKNDNKSTISIGDCKKAIIRGRKIPTSLRSREGLIRHAKDFTSQNGEDGILERLFELIPPSSGRRKRWCVDVGAWDGKHLSNTYSLLYPPTKKKTTNHSQITPTDCITWSGVFIEADDEKYQNLINLHITNDSNCSNICIHECVSCMHNSPQSLVNLLVKAAQSDTSTLQSSQIKSINYNKAKMRDLFPIHDFDFLCIDVDGIDYWILNDLLTYKGIHPDIGDTSENVVNNIIRPKVICIEFNPTMPDSVIYIPPRNDSERHGCSLAALVELCSSHGYVLVETTLYNAFFVPSDIYFKYLKEQVPIPDTSIEALHEITMGTTIYQLYDGTLKLSGCKKLLWHRQTISESAIQILSTSQRSFPFAPTSSADKSSNSSDHNSQKLQIKRKEQKTSENESITQLNQNIRDSAVDMSPYCSGSKNNRDHNDDDRRKSICAKQLWNQLETNGFALIRGTGITTNLCSQSIQQTKTLLSEVDENIRRSCLSSKDRARRGYSPMCTENFASLIGQKANNDLVRKFRIGPLQSSKQQTYNDEIPPSDTDSHTATSPLLCPNIWPSAEVWDSQNAENFQTVMESYYTRCTQVSQNILHAISDAFHQHSLNNEEYDTLHQTLTSKSRNPNEDSTILTLLGYRPGSRHKAGSKAYNQPLVAAHTDVGLITLLHFQQQQKQQQQNCHEDDSCAVLQRAGNSKENEWVDILLPFIENNDKNDPVFVLNIGDCLSDMTGGILPSTLHRVMPCPGKFTPRHCLALFVGLEPKNEIYLPSTKEKITYEDWRKQRISRATKALQQQKCIQ